MPWVRGLSISMDAFVVALLIERSFEMFESILGTWLPSRSSLQPHGGRALLFGGGRSRFSPFTGEELQVKFLPDSGEISLSY
jgi:hypothetical protein